MYKIANSQQHVLVTGAAGFIGFHLVKDLLEQGIKVTGIDNMNDYYDVDYKRLRLELLNKYSNFSFFQVDISDKDALSTIFADNKIDTVMNLAAQAGVRYSIHNPDAYVRSNITGFYNILECVRNYNVGHLVYASSSSVYGLNKEQPYSVTHNVDHPVSLYAASKKSDELMAHAYAHLYGLKMTGLRFFTVYGSWGRPDMAYFKFARRIHEGNSIRLYNYGKMERDFTHVSDISDGIMRIIDHQPSANESWDARNPDPSSSLVAYKLYNIGAGRPVDLFRFLELIEENMGKKAEVELVEMQAGDVHSTFADVSALSKDTGYAPSVKLEDGVREFIEWFNWYLKNDYKLPDCIG